MNSSLATKNQTKIRKSLRNRKVPVSLDKPNKGKHGVQRNTAKLSTTNVRGTKKFRSDAPQTSAIIGSTQSFAEKDNIADSTEIGEKMIVELSSNAVPVVRGDDGGASETPWSKNESINHMEDERESEANETDSNHNEDDNLEFEANQSQISEHSEVRENSDNEGLDEGCVERVLKEFNKDIAALYSKTSKIESEIKEIKKLLIARQQQSCIRSISSRLKQKSSSSLLPKFPLLKKSAVRKMNANVEDDDDEEDNEYKNQLVKKLASYGGDTVKELVINIFKRLFSSKLKTKYCWKGSVLGNGKLAFEALLGIRDAIWCAVKVHFEDCTESTINKEIKLRLNQAQKDYDREVLRTNVDN